MFNSQFAICNRTPGFQAPAWGRHPRCVTILIIALISLARIQVVRASDETSSSQKQVDGRTLDEWRELMKSLDFQSVAAAEAVPGLLSLVQDDGLPWYTRRQAALTLGRIGVPAQSAVPVLQRLLLDEAASVDSSTTAWAAKALSLFGPLAAEATPALVDVLSNDARPHIDRLSCVEALARIGGTHEQAVAALIEIARTEPPPTRDLQELQEAAVDGLALVGPPASPAVPTLIRLTTADSGPLRKKAAMALGAIGIASGIAAEALAELVIFDELPEVRNAAASALVTIGDQGATALRLLLSDPDAVVRALAATAIGQLVRTDDETNDVLTRALKDTDPNVRIAAAESLWRTTKTTKGVTPTIIDALTSDERQIRIRAYRLLLDLGPHARSTLPELRQLADDDRPHVRQVAIRAIREIEQSDVE